MVEAGNGLSRALRRLGEAQRDDLDRVAAAFVEADRTADDAADHRRRKRHDHPG
jgi:hypothetical protein